MSAGIAGEPIVALWLLYAGLATPVFAGLFLWALRCGQFRQQDRARYLALDDGSAPADEPEGQRPAGLRRIPAAAVVPLAFLLAVLVMMAFAAYVSGANPGR